MKIERIWSMPSRWTYKIKPIKDLLHKYVGNGFLINGLWCDPFCGKYSEAQKTNDLNPKIPAKSHLDALVYLRQWGNSFFDGVLFDPPYSPSQVKECYEGLGLEMFANCARQDYWANCKDEIKRILKPNGVVISFGWNTNGLGKGRGFKMIEILIIPHGGAKNDTLVTVETKI